MKFIEVGLENFMSYENQVFSDFNTPGLILIEGRNLDEGGSNGSGKSNMFDAIAYALFGQTVRGDKADAVKNRYVGKSCSAYVKFNANGKEYKVHRHRKPNKLEFEINGEDKTSGTNEITQKIILEELDIDFDLFRCTVIFAQGETFNFVDESSKKQKEILGKIMRIDYNTLLLKTKTRYSKIKNSIEEIQSKTIKLQAELDASDINSLEEFNEQWLEKNNIKVEEYRKEIEYIIKEEMSKIEIKDSEALNKIKVKINDRLIETNNNWQEAVKIQIQHSANASQYKKEHEKMNSLSGQCPTCLQEVDKDISGYAAHDALECWKVEDAASKELSINIDVLENNRKDLEVKFEMVNAKILENDLLKKEYVKSQEKIVKLEAEISTIEHEKNPWIERIEIAKSNIRRMKEYLEKYKIDQIEFTKDLQILDFWVNGFGDNGMKSFVFDLICSTLTVSANHYVNILTGGNIVISFDTQKMLKSGSLSDRFDCEIITDGERVSYQSYSGGEKRRISLAVDMALSDLMLDYYSSEFNIVVYDEQDYYMDNSGRIHYMELLEEQAKKKKVFVVAHDDVFKSMFDDSWVIEKKDRISRRVA